jgi:hypothetical protein
MDEAQGEGALRWAKWPIWETRWPALEPIQVQLWLAWFLVHYFPEFHDFHDRIPSCYHSVLPPHLFPIYLYAQHVETNTYPKRKIESR